MSDRLNFEKFEEKDFNEYYKLVSNEQVMAQITERAIPLDEAITNYQKLLKRNEKHVIFGSYKVYDSATEEFIGLGHLILNEVKGDEAEIGYMLLPKHWGKGYGNKIAKKLIEIAKKTKINKLKGVIDPGNVPSRKILEDHGFNSEMICEIDGLPGEILSRVI